MADLKVEHLEVRYGDLVGVADISLKVEAGKIGLLMPDHPRLGPKTLAHSDYYVAFTVDAGSLHPGTNDLVAVCKDETGHEVVSEPLDIVVISPDPAAILSGDCKDGALPKESMVKLTKVFTLVQHLS